LRVPPGQAFQAPSHPPPAPSSLRRAGEIVNVICDHFSFTSEQCLDLGVAALAAGFLLAMACALPIFKVCKMGECGKRPSPPAATSP
jgi:hypothetical protein